MKKRTMKKRTMKSLTLQERILLCEIDEIDWNFDILSPLKGMRFLDANVAATPSWDGM